MSELLPCPFCGSDDIDIRAFSAVPDCFVICKNCEARIETTVPWGKMKQKQHDKVCFEKLKKLWNTRTPQKIEHNSLCKTESYLVKERGGEK